MSTSTLGSLDNATFDFVRKMVQDRSAIVLEANKGYLVESRLTPVARRHGCATVADLVAKLKALPVGQLHEQVIDAMTTNETSFFRDIHPYETLRTHLLPEIIERRGSRRSLRIWSAACSSGQEPYSVAMLLGEHFPQLASWDVRIFATDLSQDVLQRAAAGVFSQADVNRGVPAPMLVKFFQRHGSEWIVKPEIRRLIQFTRLNLLESWSHLPTMDLLFIRNVLIYFNADTKRMLLEKCYRQMSGDGVLFLGGAETTHGICDCFTRETIGRTTIYRPGRL